MKTKSPGVIWKAVANTKALTNQNKTLIMRVKHGLRLKLYCLQKPAEQHVQNFFCSKCISFENMETIQNNYTLIQSSNSLKRKARILSRSLDQG